MTSLKRPVIILSSPRSGSTLLFEIMSSCKDLWTIGDESHAAIESIPELRINNNNFSNRLTGEIATPEIIQLLRSNFFNGLRDRQGNKPIDEKNDGYRLLEKTPKNSLRVPFLNAVFPDAYFIYLVRDPCETISSIIEAWRSNRFITYRGLPNWNINWSLLLPPGWHYFMGKSLQEVAAFQWMSSNNHIINDLKEIPSDRWTTISYKELVDKPDEHVKRLCDFCKIDYDEKLHDILASELTLSRYTQTKPDPNKWKKNEHEINSIIPLISDTTKEIDKVLKIKQERDVVWKINNP